MFEYSHFINFDLAIGADSGEYAARAKEILKGVFFPASPEIHAPLYSFFLAALQGCEINIPGVRGIQTFLNYTSWILLYHLAGKKNISHPTRLVFFGLAMILAPLIFHPAELISESLLLPLYTMVFLFFHYGEEKNASPGKQCIFNSAAGTVTGLTLLTHGLAAGFAFLAAIYLFVKRKWHNGALYIAGIMIIVVPVIAGKTIFYKKFTGLQANTGFNIFLGNNPKSTGGCYMRPGNTWRKTHVNAKKAAEEKNISTDRYWLEKAWDFWRQTPQKGVVLYFKKIPAIFSRNELIAGADGGFLFCRSDTMNLLRFLTFPVFCLAIPGLWYIFKKRKEVIWWPPLLLTLALFLMQFLTVTSGRYRLLMFPGILYLAAAGAVFSNWRKITIPIIIIFIISAFKTASFLGRNKAEGTALLGEAAFIKGDLQHAQELLLYSAKYFKDSSRIENMLGTIAERRGDFKTAAKYYRNVINNEPFMPEGWMNLANITPDPVSAEKYYLTAVQCSAAAPGSDLLFNYARLLYSRQRKKEAVKLLRQALVATPDHIKANNLYGISAMESKDFKTAAEHFYRAATTSVSEPGYWRNTAVAARCAGNKHLESIALQNFNRYSEKRNR